MELITSGNHTQKFDWMKAYKLRYSLHGAGYYSKSWQSLSLSKSLLSSRNPKVLYRDHKILNSTLSWTYRIRVNT